MAGRILTAKYYLVSQSQITLCIDEHQPLFLANRQGRRGREKKSTS